MRPLKIHVFARPLFVGRTVRLRRFAEAFLNLAAHLLGLALDLLGGVAFDGPDNVVDLAFNLFHFPADNIFLCHDFLSVRDHAGSCKASTKPIDMASDNAEPGRWMT